MIEMLARKPVEVADHISSRRHISSWFDIKICNPCALFKEGFFLVSGLHHNLIKDCKDI